MFTSQQVSALALPDTSNCPNGCVDSAGGMGTMFISRELESLLWMLSTLPLAPCDITSIHGNLDAKAYSSQFP